MEIYSVFAISVLVCSMFKCANCFMTNFIFVSFLSVKISIFPATRYVGFTSIYSYVLLMFVVLCAGGEKNVSPWCGFPSNLTLSFDLFPVCGHLSSGVYVSIIIVHCVVWFDSLVCFDPSSCIFMYFESC